MLLRNGQPQQSILDDTVRRKMLHPLSPQEEKELVSLGATGPLLEALRSPSALTTAQAAKDYNIRIEKEKLLALQQQQQQDQLRLALKAQQGSKPPTSDRPGKPLELKFTALDGSSVDLANLRGKVVMIDFWATWCGPCVGEIPNVVTAYKKYHDKGFEIVGISLDQSKAALLKMTQEKEMTWPQYFDGKGWKNAISSSFQIHSIPAMWLVDKRGIVATTEGRANLDAEIQKLLAE